MSRFRLSFAPASFTPLCHGADYNPEQPLAHVNIATLPVFA